MTQHSNTLPASFGSYLRSLGPGFVAVLTWLGAGDIVNSATAGGNYGYALMWAFALCLGVRFLFVSIIAKYQLLNPHGETVLAGLTRLHRAYAPLLFVSALALGHAVGAYMLLGIAQAWVRLTGFADERFWAVIMAVLAASITFRRNYPLLEQAFFVLASVLTLTFVSQAVWVRPSLVEIARGLFAFSIPETTGRFDSITITLSMLGAVGGGMANLMYAYFIREKGWHTPAHRRLQQYDLLFGIAVLIILDLSVWVVGAEILHPRGLRISATDDLAKLLGETLGPAGTTVFYLGLVAALFGPVVGNSAAYGYLATDAWRQLSTRRADDLRSGRLYKFVVLWTMFSPLIWVLLGHSDFIGLTLLVNAAQIVIIPVIVGGIWILTSRAKFIGEQNKNRWWENASLGILLVTTLVSSMLFVANL
jgi:Mn2+/Fe2+ NRAMP family transporter